MPDLDKIQRDKGTILSIIKYLLIAALAVAAITVGARLVVLLLPFLVGLVMARTSMAIANKIRPPKLTQSLKQANPPRAAGAGGQSHSEPVLTVPQRPPQTLYNVKLAVVIYIILEIGLVALMTGIIIASLAQLRELAMYLPDFFRQTDLVGLLMGPLRNLEGSLGLLLDENALLVIQQALVEWQSTLVASIPGTMTRVLNGIGSFVGNLPAIFLTIIVILLSGYYFITDSRNIYGFLSDSINNKAFLDKSVNLFNILSKTLLRVIGGYMLLLLITFVLVLVGLLIIQVPYAVIIALVAAIVDLLPVLGLSATLIPLAIYLFINGQIWNGVGAVVLYFAVNMIRRFIEPPILGNALRLHPMATLFSMIVGVALYGLAGVLIGPVLLVIAKEIFTEFGFDKKMRKMIGDLLTRILD
jgi:sporulation integral membrane protein YtvI